MTVDEVNQHICICNREGAFSDIGKLLAVGVDDQLRYEYLGHWIEFSPEGVCMDVMGHVLVIDTTMVRRYPPNPRGTENVLSDIRVLSIQIYELSLSCLAIEINLVQDKGPRD